MFDMMRREFITLVGCAASPVLWPLGARARGSILQTQVSCHPNWNSGR